MNNSGKDAKMPVRSIRLSVGQGLTVVVRKKSTGGIRRRVLDEDGFIRRVASVCVNEDESKVE